MKAITLEELQPALAELPHWQLAEGKLTRDLAFATFIEALAFVNQVAALAEAQNHHPDIDIRYNKVRLGLISHDANGITGRDLRLAAALDAIAPGK